MYFDYCKTWDHLGWKRYYYKKGCRMLSPPGFPSLLRSRWDVTQRFSPPHPPSPTKSESVA